MQAYVTALPQKLNADEARKTVAELREQAGTAYAGFAERGEKAWGKIRTQPQVKDAIARIETYTEKLDARVDSFVDDAHDAAEKALAAVTRQTRSVGEKAARDHREGGRRGRGVPVGEVAGKISEAGDEAAHATRSTSRRAANRTAPRPPPRRPPRSPPPGGPTARPAPDRSSRSAPSCADTPLSSRGPDDSRASGPRCCALFDGPGMCYSSRRT